MDFIIPSREGWGVEILVVVWCYGNRISSGCSPTQTFCTPALLTCDVLLMQIHGTQHSGSCPAVGSAGSTSHAHETQSGTANPGPQYYWRVRRDSQRVYHHVQVRILSTIVWQCTSPNVSFLFLFLVDCMGRSASYNSTPFWTYYFAFIYVIPHFCKCSLKICVRVYIGLHFFLFLEKSSPPLCWAAPSCLRVIIQGCVPVSLTTKLQFELPLFFQALWQGQDWLPGSPRVQVLPAFPGLWPVHCGRGWGGSRVSSHPQDCGSQRVGGSEP